MRGKRRGDSHHAMVLRREQVKTMILHGAKPTEIGKQLDVGRETVRKDMDAVYADWRAIVQAKDLWNVKMSFDHKMELHRMLMMLYHQKPRESKGEDGQVKVEDRSLIKVNCVRELIRLIDSLDKMAGIVDVRPLIHGVGAAGVGQPFDEAQVRELSKRLSKKSESERKVIVDAIIELTKPEGRSGTN